MIKAKITMIFMILLMTVLLFNTEKISVLAETGENDETLREHWARMLWENLTSIKVNASFPFVKRGSASVTDDTREELLSGAVLFLQTGNSTYLEEPEAVCEWLDSESLKKHLWFRYDVTSGWQTSIIYAVTGAYELQKLSVYANISVKWKPLLEEVVSEFIRIYVPSDTCRIVFYVNSADVVGDSECYVAYQSHTIQALSIASKVLDNDTIKNIAYRMIMNYTLGTVDLPYQSINQAGSGVDVNCKEDEAFANYLLAMQTFYFYYPANNTVKDRIEDVAFASQYMWNDVEQRWNYRTNADTGAVNNDIGVHGFGLTDEAMLNAYLIFGNTTWRDRARQDFDTMVIDGDIMNSGIIDHSTAIPQPNDGAEYWNVFARRFANIYYCFDTNQTYVDYSYFLFENVTQKHHRNLGLAQRIVCTTGADYMGYSNRRFKLQGFLCYLNKTTVTVDEFEDVFRHFGIPDLGNTIMTYVIVYFYKNDGVFYVNGSPKNNGTDMQYSLGTVLVLSGSDFTKYYGFGNWTFSYGESSESNPCSHTITHYGFYSIWLYNKWSPQEWTPDFPSTPAALQYLVNGDYLGFVHSIFTSLIGQTFYAFLLLILNLMIYLRTNSLAICSVVWLLGGGFWISAAPMVSPLAIVFTILGITGAFWTLYKGSGK